MSKHARPRVRRWQATAILTLFFIAVAGAAGIGWWYARESPPHQGPIVLISASGLRAETLPAYGAPPVDTPGIDALAEQSVVFDRAYAHSTQTLPAHASILSGELPFEHGVRDDGGFVLDARVRTLAELLRNRGFSTGAAVSSFLLRRETGIGQGFSFFDADGPPDPDSIAAAETVRATRPGNLTLDAAERWARTRDGQRYFLLVQVPAADADLAVTRIVRLLEARKLYDGATIVLAGDHGPGDSGSALDERAIRIPLLIKQPAREGAGRRVAVPVQQIDLAPTILDLVRAPIPGELRGRSLKPVLSDGDGRLTPQPIYSESLAAYFRLGGHPLFALTVNGSRYLRGGVETLVTIDVADTAAGAQTPATDAAPASATVVEDAANQMAPLRATLDRLTVRRPMVPPAAPEESDRDRLALAGYLAGLRPSSEAGAITIDDPTEQQALAAAHEEAARLVGERRLPAAIRALQAIVRGHPELAAVHYQIGALCLELGRTAEAFASFRQAASLRPDAAEIPRALAPALARTGNVEDARAQAALGVTLAKPLGASELATAYQVAARVALINGDSEAALRDADAAQSADPSIPMHAYVEARLLVDAGRYEEAVPILQQAGAMLRQHGSTLEGLQASLGDALSHLNRSADAEAAFAAEIRTFPHHVDAYVGLARVYDSAGQDAAAETVVRGLLDAVPTPDAYAAAIGLWSDLGQRSRAEAIRSEARGRFRGDLSLAALARDRRQ